MSKTKIEWAHHTWNPVTGCTKISPGCRNCYAERMARRLAGRYGYPQAPHHFDVTLHPNRLDEPLKHKKPTTYFVCSMGDLFHKDIPTHYIADVWNVMRQCPQHTFQVLTKRPYPMASILLDWGVILPNVWLGVTAENQRTADKRIPILLQTPAAVHFVSCEPLLKTLTLQPSWFRNQPPQFSQREVFLGGLDWVIVGGESGPGARPIHPQWVRDIRDQCLAADVPLFFKQWGAWAPLASADEASRYPNAQLHEFQDGTRSVRIGKHRTGHLLTGQEHREFPTP